MSSLRIGVIGGSGLYQMDGLQFLREETVVTPFGEPSDTYRLFKISTPQGDAELVFLPRHGRNHHVNPSEVNYRANIYGMKVLGVSWIIAVSAVGSLQEEIVPGHIVLVDQFIDRTTKRQNTFFEKGVVAHVQFGEPVCEVLRGYLLATAKEQGHTFHDGGAYVNMEGPAFSTKAESDMHRAWGASVIGMTCLTEARLAREAEISYGLLSMATDYDCWRVGHAHVSNDEVVKTMQTNVKIAKDVIKSAIPKILQHKGEAPQAHALKGAIMTHADHIPDRVRVDLAPILGKYIGVPSSVVFAERKHHEEEVKRDQEARAKLHPHQNPIVHHLGLLLVGAAFLLSDVLSA